jgi:hypothetical protein
MSEPAYTIRLGSGLYLDNEGVLHQGVTPPVPSYAMPGGVLATLNEASKLAKTFQDIGGKLPNKSDSQKYTEFVDKLKDMGAPEELGKLLAVVGQIASAIGTVFVAAGVVVAAAKLLGMFGEGPSPLEILIKARFDALDKEVRALQNLISAHDLRTQRDALIAARSAVESFVSQRDSGTMTAAQIESRLQTLISLLSVDSMGKILSLLDSSTYTVFFDTDEHTKVWPWITRNLFRVPVKQAQQRATFPAVNAPVFDHRLAVPLAAHAAQTFLAIIHSLAPEFRTTGDFRPNLRDCADKLSDLAQTLRDTALARTIFTESDFMSPIDDFYVSEPLPGLTPPSLKPDYYLVVGAIDLCSHNDAFFSDVAKGGGVAFPGPSRRGSLDFRWRPPAKLARRALSSGLVHMDGSPIIQYDITNPKECADAANQQAEQDYSDLLLSSGYLTLVQLEAQMRHTATQPNPSETVRGDVLLQRLPQTGSEVTVHSDGGPFLFTATDDIEAQAWRQAQKVRAFASCTTQAIPRTAPLIHYRLLLRTLSSAFPPRLWLNPHYESVQSADYANDPLHTGFQRLFLQNSSAGVLHEELLLEGSSQSGVRHIEPTLEFKAHTFDWWIPVQPNPRVSDHVSATREVRTIAGKSPGKAPFKIPPTIASLILPVRDRVDASVVLGLGWEDGAQTWQGERREPAEATIKVKVKLDWQANRINLAIENRPEDRNYIIFLVLEETFGSVESDEQAPKVLHTAFPIAINGQLTFVPQALFDQEKKARERQKSFAEEYAITAVPGPGDPINAMIHPGELTTDAGVARLAATLHQFKPELVKKLIRKQQAHHA